MCWGDAVSEGDDSDAPKRKRKRKTSGTRGGEAESPQHGNGVASRAPSVSPIQPGPSGQQSHPRLQPVQALDARNRAQVALPC